jgi:hypothetical protein
MSIPDRRFEHHAPHASHDQPPAAPPTPSMPALDVALARLAQEDAVGQLRRRAGKMLVLGSENGDPMLDWVEAVPRLLADSVGLELVEMEARQLVARGIRHVIWAGMGGSVLAVRVLRSLGFCGDAVQLHPLDSTDPRALNQLVRQLTEAKDIMLPAIAASAVPGERQLAGAAQERDARAGMPGEDALCRALLADVLMIGVAMGKTSEEPISHLDWFAELLRRGGLPNDEHLLVMSIPDSYLEHYAQSHGIPRLALQLDGGSGTPGRMSAPATRVFLLPAALDLASRGAAPGSLRNVLAQAWAAYDLEGAATNPRRHPFVRLAAALAAAASAGACALWLVLPPELDGLRWWTEQLMEESLGKGGKGVVVFADQTLSTAALAADSGVRSFGGLRLRIAPASAPDGTEPLPTLGADRSDSDPAASTLTLYQPLLAGATPEERLAGLAAIFLGLQLSTALYGYLCDIAFAGQPAVEQYKRRARDLREMDDPIQVALAATVPYTEDRFRLLPPPSSAGASTAMPVAEALAAALTSRPTYLDLTINGEVSDEDMAALEAQLRQLGNDVLGVLVKLRRAPASYHSTEQSEMDGPAGLLSVRALAERSDAILLGAYDATFLRAQAVGTWMAMNEQGRTCFMLLYDGTNDELGPAICGYLASLARQLPIALPSGDGGA